MEVRTYVRKIAALATGLTMVGATIFGASAAADLSMYPAPFIKDGQPTKLAIIVGDAAAASDVIGSVDIAQQLQKDAVIKVAVAGGATKKVALKGDAKEIGTGSDLLELNETIGDVNEILTSSDVAALAGGRITTDRGTTDFSQYLEFNETATFNGLKVQYTEDEYDNVGDFFFVDDGQELFNWKIEFEDGLETDIVSGDLEDLEDEQMTILGKLFTIVDTDIVGTSITFQMLSGPVQDTLGEGESKSYEINGKEYKVEVLVISETANDGDGEVLIRVNGETLDKLSDGETDTMADGTLFGIRDIVATGKDTQKSIVRFYVGANEIELEDSDYTDSLYTNSGAEVDKEDVEDGRVRIRASNLTGSRISVSTMEYSLLVDAKKGDLFVSKGHGVREFLDEPEGMLVTDWDIQYGGLVDVTTHQVKLDANGDDSYDLAFTNQEGIAYKIPFLTHEDGIFKFGDDDDDLWFQEFSNLTLALSDAARPNETQGFAACTNATNPPFSTYVITSDDMFILSDGASIAGGDNTAFTHVLSWDNVDITNRKLTFSDESGGSKEIIYGAVSRRGNLIVGGHNYDVYVALANGSIWVDLNGDGSANDVDTNATVADGRAVISAMGELLIDPYANSVCTGFPGVSTNSFLALPRVNGSTVLMNFVTLAKEFDESGAGGTTGNEIVTVGVSNRSSNEIGLATPNASPPFLNFNELKDNEDIDRGMTLFGALYEVFDPSGSDEAEELTIDYPEDQRGVQVFVAFGATESEEVGGLAATQVVPIQIGAAKLASEVADVTAYNAVVVGGPCANDIAADLLGNPADCSAGFVDGEAVLKLWEHSNGNVALLVAGFSALDTRRAARVLANYKDYSGALKGKEVKVKGTTLSDIRIENVA